MLRVCSSLSGMEFALQISLASAVRRIQSWWATVDHENAGFSILLLIALVLLRRPLARLIVGAVSRLLSHLTSELGPKTQTRLQRASEVLLVALGVLAFVQALEFPPFVGDMLKNAVATVAIIAVFATWYEMAESFISILKTGDFQDVALEADWTTRVTQFAIVLFGITAVLKIWNVDISGALTGVGVLGAGLALAAQDLVRNLIAGMTNQREKRFVVGDAIEVMGSFIGTVKRIDLRSTLVLGFDQVPHHVPNADLSNSIVKNYSRMVNRRVLVTFRLLLSSSREQIEQVRKGLERYLHDSGDFVLSDDAPKYVHIAEIGESSIDVLFYAWTHSGAYSDYLAVCDRLALSAKELVEKAGTELAFPTQTVHLQSAEMPAFHDKT